MYLGDNLIKNPLSPFLDQFKQNKLDGLILLRPVENPTAFGVAVVNDKGRVTQLVEKPKDPPSNLALVGVYFFDRTIHEAIANIQPSARGELEITDAIQELINTDKHVEACTLEGWWLDTGKKDDLLSANQIILDEQVQPKNAAEVNENSQIIGRVDIGPGTQLINCKIRGPVRIGSNCYLEDCFIGPYSSVGDDVTIIDAELEHSVILKGAKITKIHHRIVDTLVGRRAQLTTVPHRPKALRFMLGDDSQIELT